MVLLHGKYQQQLSSIIIFGCGKAGVGIFGSVQEVNYVYDEVSDVQIWYTYPKGLDKVDLFPNTVYECSMYYVDLVLKHLLKRVNDFILF